MPKLIEGEENFVNHVSVPTPGDPASSAVIENALQILLSNTEWLRTALSALGDLSSAHADAEGDVHGATSEATGGAIMRRAEGGQVKVAAPLENGHATNQGYVKDAIAASKIPGGASEGWEQLWLERPGDTHTLTPGIFVFIRGGGSAGINLEYYFDGRWQIAETLVGYKLIVSPDGTPTRLWAVGSGSSREYWLLKLS